MRFRMKIAQWYKYFYFGIGLYLTGMTVFLILEQAILAAIIMIPVLLLIITLLTHSYYVLEEDHIFMRNSVFFKRIKYEDITEIVRTKRWKKQNFAMDKDRITIKVGNKSSLFSETDISPIALEEVLSELQRRCRNIKNSTDSTIDFE